MRRLLLIAIFATALFNASAVVAKPLTWVATWGASPMPPNEAIPGKAQASPSFNNQTIRQVVRISAGGKRLRLRLSNEYGQTPLHIGAAEIAVRFRPGDSFRSNSRAVTFRGLRDAVIPAGAPLLSDQIELAVPNLAEVEITLYLPQETGPCTCHLFGMARTQVSPQGDFTGREFAPERSILARPFLTAVEVEAAPSARTIVTFGDSITDGVGSTVDSNKRWPDLLAERLANRKQGPVRSVANQGIGGNRVLSQALGQSALSRFDRDVLGVAGVGYVVVFEGVNDLSTLYGPLSSSVSRRLTAEELIGGYVQLIERAHARGVRVIGATITPYEGAFYFTPEGEAIRQTVNRWIRTSGAFDAVLDFDVVLADPRNPSRIREGFHPGDHLHGSDAGYQALANSIDLAIFR